MGLDPGPYISEGRDIDWAANGPVGRCPEWEGQNGQLLEWWRKPQREAVSPLHSLCLLVVPDPLLLSSPLLEISQGQGGSKFTRDSARRRRRRLGGGGDGRPREGLLRGRVLDPGDRPGPRPPRLPPPGELLLPRAA